MSNVLSFPGPHKRGTQRSVAQDPIAQGPVRREPSRPEPLWRESVGAVLREERASRGERIVDVAARAGVAPQYLSEIERGCKDPSSEVLSAVSGALKLGIGELATRVAARFTVDGPTCLAA